MEETVVNLQLSAEDGKQTQENAERINCTDINTEELCEEPLTTVEKNLESIETKIIFNPSELIQTSSELFLETVDCIVDLAENVTNSAQQLEESVETITKTQESITGNAQVIVHQSELCPTTMEVSEEVEFRPSGEEAENHEEPMESVAQNQDSTDVHVSSHQLDPSPESSDVLEEAIELINEMTDNTEELSEIVEEPVETIAENQDSADAQGSPNPSDTCQSSESLNETSEQSENFIEMPVISQIDMDVETTQVQEPNEADLVEESQETVEDMPIQTEENTTNIEDANHSIAQPNLIKKELVDNNALNPKEKNSGSIEDAPSNSTPPLKVALKLKARPKKIRPVYSKLRTRTKCHICSHYIKRSSIGRHIKYVHGEMVIQCIICKRSFHRPDSARNHLLCHHQIDPAFTKDYLADVRKGDLPEEEAPYSRSRPRPVSAPNIALLASITAFNCHDCDETFHSIAELFTHCDLHRLSEDGKKLPTLRPPKIRKRINH